MERSQVSLKIAMIPKALTVINADDSPPRHAARNEALAMPFITT